MSVYNLNTVHIAESYMLDRVTAEVFHVNGSKALINISYKKPNRKLTKAQNDMRMSIISFYSLVGNSAEFNIPNFITYSMPKDMDKFYMTLTQLIMKYPEKSDDQIDYENKVIKAREKILSIQLSS